jgi:transcriptional regulator with XRE-family HTH domain
MSIGQNIKRLRTEKGMTQTELGNELGLGKSYICQLERDSKTPTLALGNQIAEVFNVPINELLE